MERDFRSPSRSMITPPIAGCAVAGGEDDAIMGTGAIGTDSGFHKYSLRSPHNIALTIIL
jgi:hypothetical protein